MLKKITLSIMLLLSLGGISYADFVYATSEGSIGTIKISSSSDITPSIQYNGETDSPFLTSYWNGSGTSILLLDRFGSLSGDRGYIFSPSDLTNFSKSTDIAGVYGTELSAFSENGYSLYLASGPEIYEVSTQTFTVINSFDCSQVISADGVSTDITGLAVDAQTIHVLASAGERVEYIRFEGQLKEGTKLFISCDVESGSSALMSISNYAVVGHSYGIDMIDTRNRFYRALSTDYPVKALCTDENGRLYCSTQYYDGEKYVNTVKHLAEGTKFPDTVIESSSPNIKLIRDNDHKESFAAMTDEKIVIFTYKNNAASSREYSSSELGGTPAGIASATVSGYNGSASSSGCDVSGLGVLMIAAMFMIRRK